MTNDEVFQNGFSIYGPVPVQNRPGLFWVRFVPRTLMPVRGPGGAPERVRIWDGSVTVDSAGDGSVVAHRQLTPPVAELEPIDFERKALELVRELRAPAA